MRPALLDLRVPDAPTTRRTSFRRGPTLAALVFVVATFGFAAETAAQPYIVPPPNAAPPCPRGLELLESELARLTETRWEHWRRTLGSDDAATDAVEAESDDLIEQAAERARRDCEVLRSVAVDSTNTLPTGAARLVPRLRLVVDVRSQFVVETTSARQVGRTDVVLSRRRLRARGGAVMIWLVADFARRRTT